MPVTITPWEIKGELLGIDYDKLIKQFGTEPITDQLLDRIKRAAGGELHVLLRRKFFFCHRDLNWIFDEYERGNPFYVYTGRGPSGPVHLGHLLPWILCKWLQDKFDAELWFQMSDDEKFFATALSTEEVRYWTIENALDVIALGFDPHKTKIFIDTENAKTMYKQAVKVAKNINWSMARATFGFKPSTNIGLAFYTSMQAVLAFLPSVLAGRPRPCLIPLGLDQDPHFRLARDVLPKLGWPKPALLHSKFLIGLGKGGKMSASQPHTAIYTTDTEEEVREKIIKHAFSGGQATIAEHRQKGGVPEIDVAYQWLQAYFEPDDTKLIKIYNAYKSGALLTSEIKEILIKAVCGFLKQHQKEREKARDKLDKFLFKD